MPKVTVTFSDTQKEDSLGNPVVDIDTQSTPQFPNDDSKHSPSQKAALSFLARGGQPEVAKLLRVLQGEVLKLQNELVKVAEAQESESPALPFDFKLIELHLKDFSAIIDENLGSFE